MVGSLVALMFGTAYAADPPLQLWLYNSGNIAVAYYEWHGLGGCPTTPCPLPVTPDTATLADLPAGYEMAEVWMNGWSFNTWEHTNTRVKELGVDIGKTAYDPVTGKLDVEFIATIRDDAGLVPYEANVWFVVALVKGPAHLSVGTPGCDDVDHDGVCRWNEPDPSLLYYRITGGAPGAYVPVSLGLQSFHIAHQGGEAIALKDIGVRGDIVGKVGDNVDMDLHCQLVGSIPPQGAEEGGFPVADVTCQTSFVLLSALADEAAAGAMTDGPFTLGTFFSTTSGITPSVSSDGIIGGQRGFELSLCGPHTTWAWAAGYQNYPSYDAGGNIVYDIIGFIGNNAGSYFNLAGTYFGLLVHGLDALTRY